MKWPRALTDGSGPYVVAGALAVVIHVGLGAGGMAAADRWGHGREPTPPIVVAIVPVEHKPEPKPDPPKPEPKPEPPKPDVPLPKTEPPKIRKVSHEPPPPVKADKPPEQKPPPKPDEPPPLLEVPMASTTTGPSNVTVNASDEGNLKGDPNGVKGGKGKPGTRTTGDPNGDPKGVPGGTGTKAADVYCCKTEPKVLKEVEARYPDDAEREGIEGSVKLAVEIDEQGHVRKVKVLKGLGHGLDEAAVEALKRFQFSPAIASDGKPAAKTITYTYTFVIP